MSGFRASSIAIALVSIVAIAGCVARPPGSDGTSVAPSAPAATDRGTPVAPTASPSRSPFQTPPTGPSDPELYARLPADVLGIQLIRFVAPGSQFPRGGDVCSFVCPEEVMSFVEALDIGVEDVAMGFAWQEAAMQDPLPPGVLKAWVVAFRARGVATARLVGARIANMPQLDVPQQELSSDGKALVRIWYSFGAQYLYAHEDTLYVIYGEDARAPDDFNTWRPNSPIPADVAAMISALP